MKHVSHLHRLVLAGVIFTQLTVAGGKHTVIPGVSGNTLTLEVINRLGHPLDELSLVVVAKPVWVTVTAHSGHEVSLRPDSIAELTFSFSTAVELEADAEDSLVINVLASGTVVARQIVSLMVAVPQEYALSQNYPNPFNPTTHIRYELPEVTHVRLMVYDMLGREVVRLVDEEKPAGYFEARWDGLSSAGTAVASGVYFYRLHAVGVSGRTATQLKKMVAVK